MKFIKFILKLILIVVVIVSSLGIYDYIKLLYKTGKLGTVSASYVQICEVEE